MSSNEWQVSKVHSQLSQWLPEDMACLFEQVNLPEPLNEASRYAVENGGKRVRPLLVLASYLTLASLSDKEAIAMVRRAMMAVELIHGYSLVHDDLPCMDDDNLRRGKPTCHIVYGEATALLAGDVLQALAYESLTIPLPNIVCDMVLAGQLCHVLTSRARRMVAGQQLDLNGEQCQLTQHQLEAIHQDKTGALIEAAVLMGGICAKADKKQMEILAEYAATLGLAFQVQDDVLDVVADTKTLGKPAKSDEKLQKSTYVQLLGVSFASEYAKSLFAHARLVVSELGENNLLAQVADWLQNRTY